MKKVEQMTMDEKYDFLNVLIDEYGMETYEDFAGMCKRLSMAARCAYDVTEELDEVEKSNLLSLEKLLSVCAEMFIVCDDYYRWGKIEKAVRPADFREEE